jgi:hypothetical protein
LPGLLELPGVHRAGAEVTGLAGSDDVTGEVLAVDEPNALAFSWGEEIRRFELSTESGGTHLVLTDELPAGAAARNAAGWETCLDRLAGLDPDPEAWRSHFATYSAAFELILGTQEGLPPGYKGN